MHASFTFCLKITSPSWLTKADLKCKHHLLTLFSVIASSWPWAPSGSVHTETHLKQAELHPGNLSAQHTVPSHFSSLKSLHSKVWFTVECYCVLHSKALQLQLPDLQQQAPVEAVLGAQHGSWLSNSITSLTASSSAGICWVFNSWPPLVLSWALHHTLMTKEVLQEEDGQYFCCADLQRQENWLIFKKHWTHKKWKTRNKSPSSASPHARCSFFLHISCTHSLLHAPHTHHSEQITDNPQKTEDVLLSKELQYNKCVICTKDTVEQV